MAIEPTEGAARKQESLLLRQRLQDAEQTLNAIRSGAVDSVVVRTGNGSQLFTLGPADVLYRVFFEQLPHGAATLESGGVILHCNPRLAVMLDTPVEQMLGAKWTDFVAEQDGPKVADLLRLPAGERQEVELSLRTGGGAEVPVRAAASSFRVSEIPLFSIILTDITPIKRAQAEIQYRIEELSASEEELRQTNQELTESQHALEEDRRAYRELFERAPIGYLVTTPVGQITKANEGAQRLLNAEPGFIVGMSMRGFVPTEEHAQLFRCMRDLRQGRCESVRDLELVLKPVKRPPVPCAVTLAAIKSEAGTVLNLRWLVADIRQRKTAEESLRASERALAAERQRLLGMLSMLPFSVCLLRPDYHIVYANPTFEKMFGTADGRHCYEFIFGQEAPRSWCRSFEPLQTGKPVQWRCTGPDGKTIVEVHDFPFQDADGSPLIMEVDIDVTEHERSRELLEQRVRDRTAELEASSQEMESFAYSVSHDLRAPLRAIDGFAQILLQEHVDALPEKPRHYLQMVCDNARQMGRLIDDILRLSRLGRQSIIMETVDMASLVQQCLDELHAARAERHVAIQIGELPSCFGDAGLIKQVWFNLLSNALKFTAKRDPACIEIGSFVPVGQAFQPDGQAGKPNLPSARDTVYFVKDNGVGFDMQYVGKLFGVFQRLHPVEEFEGTGIGLALCKRIAQRHGGRIWAEAKVNEGATFFFTVGRRPGHD